MSRSAPAYRTFAMRCCPPVSPRIVMPPSNDHSSDTDAHACYAIHLRLRTEATPPAVPWVEPPLCLRRADGSLDLLGRSRNLIAAARLVLSYGRYATVLESPALRRAVAAEARRVLRQCGCRCETETGRPRTACPLHSGT